MFKGDTIPSLVSIGIGTLFFIPSIGLGFMSSTSDGVQGAGFFPLLISVALIVCGIILLVKSLVKKGKTPFFQNSDKTNKKTFLITLAVIAGSLLIWKFLFFPVAAFIMAFLLNWIYKRNLKFNIIYSGIFVSMIYLIFNVLLRIQFAI